MELKSLFKNQNEKEFQTLSESPLYKILNESLNHLQIIFSTRDEDKLFHFDCEKNSKRNIYKRIFELLTNEQRRELLENVGLSKKVPIELKDDIFLIELKKKLETFNVDIQNKDKNNYCLYLKSEQDASCVGSLLHAMRLKNQGSQRFKNFHLGPLSEYANNNQVMDVKKFFERNKNKNLQIKYGDSMVICCVIE